MLVEAKTRHGRQFLNLARALVLWEDRLWGGSVVIINAALTIETNVPPRDLIERAGEGWVSLTRAPLADGSTPTIWVNAHRVRGVRLVNGFTHLDFAGRWEHVQEPIDEVAARLNDALGKQSA